MERPLKDECFPISCPSQILYDFTDRLLLLHPIKEPSQSTGNLTELHVPKNRCTLNEIVFDRHAKVLVIRETRRHKTALAAKSEGVTSDRSRGHSVEALDYAVRQLVAKAIAPEGGIIDVFQAAGLKQPDISILSDQFLAEVRGLKYKNVAAELLAKLLGDEIKVRSKRNLVQSREFSEMLKKTLNAYHNRAIATQEVIEELIKLAKQLSEGGKRGEELGLNDEEVAFYDALSQNNSALEVMGKDNLKVIATELVTQVRKSVTIDWTLRESARAKIKVLVKRILKKHGYPPDLQEEATRLVLQQAELLCAEWAA